MVVVLGEKTLLTDNEGVVALTIAEALAFPPAPVQVRV
jgi:hypothetical protein